MSSQGGELQFIFRTAVVYIISDLTCSLIFHTPWFDPLLLDLDWRTYFSIAGVSSDCWYRITSHSNLFSNSLNIVTNISTGSLTWLEFFQLFIMLFLELLFNLFFYGFINVSFYFRTSCLVVFIRWVLSLWFICLFLSCVFFIAVQQILLEKLPHPYWCVLLSLLVWRITIHVACAIWLKSYYRRTLLVSNI